MEKLELKHLAPYLPYGLECNYDTRIDKGAHYGINCRITGADHDGVKLEMPLGWLVYKYIKPILRPLSDLTEEEVSELTKICHCFEYNKEYLQLDCLWFLTLDYEIDIEFSEVFKLTQKLFEWHFDVFGLIEQGLAIDINTLEI